MKDNTWHEIDRITRAFLEQCPGWQTVDGQPQILKDFIGINLRNWNEVRVMRNITKEEQKEMPNQINEKADEALKLYGEYVQSVADEENARIQKLIDADQGLRQKWYIQNNLVAGLQQINKRLENQIKAKERQEDNLWKKVVILWNAWAAWRHFVPSTEAEHETIAAQEKHDADKRALEALEKFCDDVELRMRMPPPGMGGHVVDCSGGIASRWA